MRVLSVLLLLMLTPVTLAANKVENIIVAMGGKDNLTQALDAVRPYAIKIDESDAGEANELLLRHQKAKAALYDDYFAWGKLLPEVVAAFKSVYTKDEIDEIHDFLSSPHGAKFFKHLGDLDKAYSGVLMNSFQEYEPEFNRLSERHSHELNRLIEKETAKQASLPKPKVDPHAPTTLGDVARFMVATQNGEMIGYIVRPGRKEGLFERSGLQQNDLLVSVSGLLVNKPQAVRDVYSILKGARQVHVEVERDGEYIDFVIDLDEIESQK